MKKLTSIALVLALFLAVGCSDDHKDRQGGNVDVNDNNNVNNDDNNNVNNNDNNVSVADLTVDNATCKDGKLAIKDGDKVVSLDDVFACDSVDGYILGCRENVLIKRSQVCDAKGILYCNNVSENKDVKDYQIVTVNCATNETCVENTRRGLETATCFNKDNVTSNCGDVKVFGNCDGNSLVMCSNDSGDGKLIRIDCDVEGQAKNVTESCGLVDDTYGYDCRIMCKAADSDQDITEFGSCNENKVEYCKQDGSYDVLDCSEFDEVCGLNDFYMDCISKNN